MAPWSASKLIGLNWLALSNASILYLPQTGPSYPFATRQEALAACQNEGFNDLCSKSQLTGHSVCAAGWLSDSNGYWMKETQSGCGSAGFNEWSGSSGAYCCHIVPKEEAAPTCGAGSGCRGTRGQFGDFGACVNSDGWKCWHPCDCTKKPEGYGAASTPLVSAFRDPTYCTKTKAADVTFLMKEFCSQNLHRDGTISFCALVYRDGSCSTETSGTSTGQSRPTVPKEEAVSHAIVPKEEAAPTCRAGSGCRGTKGQFGDLGACVNSDGWKCWHPCDCTKKPEGYGAASAPLVSAFRDPTYCTKTKAADVTFLMKEFCSQNLHRDGTLSFCALTYGDGSCGAITVQSNTDRITGMIASHAHGHGSILATLTVATLLSIATNVR